MSVDSLIQFEESHYEGLAEKFIEKNLKLWQDFVLEEYESSMPPYLED